jgi:hypothetical protein
MLLDAGFEDRMKDIKLSERGSGYWAWKPFIINEALARLPDGDLVFYCDVGRRYPFKTLEKSINPYIEWMRNEDQSVMPGIYIPWKGPMSMWTKRAAFRAASIDNDVAHRSSPIQASFSLWITNTDSRALCGEWLRLCSEACLINDSPSPAPLKELPDFFEHRHDQSLLSLICLKHNIKGIHIGELMPAIDTQHPDDILGIMDYKFGSRTLAGCTVNAFAIILGAAERAIRARLKFGKDRQEPNFKQIRTSKQL